MKSPDKGKASEVTNRKEKREEPAEKGLEERSETSESPQTSSSALHYFTKLVENVDQILMAVVFSYIAY